MADVKPAYLIAGTDIAKIEATRARLRARAEGDGDGTGSLEVFEPHEGRSAPDAEGVVAALPAMSLTPGRRYVLADGVERWKPADCESVAAALAALPPETTLVLIARDKPPPRLAKAVEAAGGEVLAYDAPRERDLPARLVAEAAKRGFRLEIEAARLLVDRMGSSSVRLANELDRLALWAGNGGEVSAADLEAMIADTSEAALWALSDALIEGDSARAMAIGERLIAQGEPLPRLVYGLAGRLRQAQQVVAQLEAGRSPADAAAGLKMHPYAAKMLVRRLRDASSDDLRQATIALADLEVATRGGSDHSEQVSLTLSLRRALGAAA
ncbi:MAG: polymerase subunit delta [Solirubrobacterales bacterium]|nr:polymerase subunit delta [Solirubrobacterales bacterium]